MPQGGVVHLKGELSTVKREIETCIYEVKPYIGDYITVGTFETSKKETRIINLCDNQIFIANDMLT